MLRDMEMQLVGLCLCRLHLIRSAAEAPAAVTDKGEWQTHRILHCTAQSLANSHTQTRTHTHKHTYAKDIVIYSVPHQLIKERSGSTTDSRGGSTLKVCICCI